MAFKQVLEAIEVLSSASVDGPEVARLLNARGITDVVVEHVETPVTATDFVSCLVPGRDATLPALGVIGRLGGVGARPDIIGMVSDADGATVALATALKLADMARAGDVLPGPVRIHTHLCTHAETRPNHPVRLMRSPLPARQMMQREVHADMAAILSVDAARGNRFVNKRGVALTPVVKEGWLLRVPDDMLELIGWVSGELPIVMPLVTQDITPQENGLWHINSIAQPATATNAPIIGVALTAQTTVPGCATGVSNPGDLDVATRFCIEVAKRFALGTCPFFDPAEFDALVKRYGSLRHLQGLGAQ